MCLYVKRDEAQQVSVKMMCSSTRGRSELKRRARSVQQAQCGRQLTAPLRLHNQERSVRADDDEKPLLESRHAEMEGMLVWRNM
mmetsp:Transcript_23678/g.51768  ORF Transcript_23678/g.51768 Transcript_23678/m.51768 type:complete len:84 (+) Transcript_23678:456-707(+)